MLARWSGVVETISSETFVARLTATDENWPDHVAEFPVAQVETFDRELLSPGATFYWVLGYRDTGYRRHAQESVLIFRRLPKWTKAEIEAARESPSPFADLFAAAEIPPAIER